MKILIIDDSYSWLEFHKTYVEEIFIELDIKDYTIDLANCAQSGYDHLLQNDKNPYDIIITDLQMEENFSPKYAGEWFVEQIRNFKSYLQTNTIICSGCYNIKQIAESLGTAYIPKRVAATDINQYKSVIIKFIEKKL